MRVGVCRQFRGGVAVAALVGLFAAGIFAVPASAQTVSLAAADATLRGGSYDDVNYGTGDLATKASTNASYVRRALLKFDTHTTIPSGSAITSATLTLTVKRGDVSGRRLAVYCVPSSFDEFQVTWRLRKGTLYWRAPGGDATHQHGTVAVTNVAGSKVTIDATAIAREALQRASRYTRLLLVDIDSATTASYMAYYSNEASATLRPKLVVNYGPATTTTPPPTTTTPPPPTTTGSTLKVLQWNIAQGYGTDGKSNLDRVVNWLVLIKPDVISFNEIMKYSSHNQLQIIADKLKARTGQTWYYHWAQISGASSGIGVAVMSRFPFDDTDSHLLSYDRSAALVRIMVNGRIVNVISTHLDHLYSSRRLTQVKELKAWAAGFAEQRIIPGDFNRWPGTPEILEMDEDYYDAWAVAKSKGTAVSYDGNSIGATRNTRIDYVFYSKRAAYLTLTGTRVFDTRADMVSDHRPVLATFKVN